VHPPCRIGTPQPPRVRRAADVVHRGPQQRDLPRERIGPSVRRRDRSRRRRPGKPDEGSPEHTHDAKDRVDLFQGAVSGAISILQSIECRVILRWIIKCLCGHHVHVCTTPGLCRASARRLQSPRIPNPCYARTALKKIRTQ